MKYAIQNPEVAEYTVTFSSTLKCTMEQALALFDALCEANCKLVDQDELVYDNEDCPVSAYILNDEGHAIY